jgi:predicted cation transporter
MVIVTVAGPEPPGTLGGEKAATAPVGRPLAKSAIAFEKMLAPFAGLTKKVFAAVPPGRAVAELLAALMVKSVAADRLMVTV